jgi:S-adenosylmethionine:tRNA ribosyltransferase-isomerase
VKTSDFDYDLPVDRIAQFPVEPRDSARLLVDRGSHSPQHLRVSDLDSLLSAGDLLVVNDTKVIPARLNLSRASGGRVEVLLLEKSDSAANDRTWTAMVKPGGRLRPGEELFDSEGNPVLSFGGRSVDHDTFVVEFVSQADPALTIDRLGEMPLPPYITDRSSDRDRYQTVYARRAASAAAPTAGLHFTPDLLARIEELGASIARVELVVGLDTFKPVSVEDPSQHAMHSEWFSVDRSVLDRAREARRVVAVGTTAVRSLESAATTGRLEGRTDLFIRRGHQWKVVDLMMTNFHLPRTTLLMMIDAFVGSRWRNLYEIALDSDYRFLSFGDAMLLDRHAT